jgi:hypothetical protein
VALKASGSPSALTATPTDGGEFSFDVAALAAPYRLKAESASGALYAVATKPGVTNVNEITTVVAAASSPDGDAETSWTGRDSGSSDDIERILKSLTTVLKPLFDLYGVTRIDDDDPAVRALLKDVSFIVKGRLVTVKNRATGAVIFTGSLRDLASGTFTPANMPAGPVGTTPSTCASFTYSAWGACQADGTQTRTVATSSPAGCTGGTPVTSQSCTYVPPGPATCQYTYSAWGACQPNGTQTRTVLTSGPAGCTGTPVTSQSCTYVPPAPTCTSFTYSAWGTCQSNNTQTRTVLTSSPTGCTGGTPVTSQSCTYTAACTLATAVASCNACHSVPPASHNQSVKTCATCHGPVNNGTGTPSTGMTATVNSSGACVLNYPTNGTHDNGVVNRGAAQ